MVGEFFVGRLLEGREVHALRINRANDVSNYAALPGGVHSLQHEQHSLRRA